MIILLAFFAVGCYMLSLQLKADSYVQVEAVVVDYVKRNEHTERFDHSSTIPTYYNIVEYEFGGEVYRAACDTPASTYDPPNDNGEIINIFVNPNNPKDVVFRNSTHILLITVSYVVSVGGLCAVVFVFRKAHRNKQLLKEYYKQNGQKQ